MTRTCSANPVTVNPFGAAARTRTAANALRIRARFRSMPPTRVAPICDAVGSSSRVWSGMKPMSTQSSGAEPLRHAGQSGDDLAEHVDPAPALQFLGVMHDRLEPQHTFAFGVHLQRQTPEMDLEI